MTSPTAIIVGSLIVAAAIAMASRWEIIIGNEVTVRLDRWTGSAQVCFPVPAANSPDEIEINLTCGTLSSKKK